MKAKANSENVRGDKTPFMGKTADREPSACEQRRHEREESRVNGAAEGVARGAQNGIARGTARVDRGDDGPPNPPLTRDGPAGHYGEGENAEEGGADEMTEEEFDRYLEAQLNGAEQDLIAAIQAAQRMVGAEEAVTLVIDALGNSIIATRQAHIAGIQLRVATADLISVTTQRAAGARQAIADAAFAA
jgi:hypothetical protein